MKTQQRVNPIRIALLLIGVFSIVTNFILLVFVVSGSTGAFKYLLTVMGVSVISIIAAEIMDNRRKI